MEDARENEAGQGLEEQIRPFSVVFAPTATLAVQKHEDHLGGAVLMRHLCAPQPQPCRDRSISATKQRSPRLSNIVVVVRAKPYSLHLFRGRKLCRVVEFPSSVMDIAGLPWGSSAAAQSTGTLCVVACRDGTAYALPVAEVLEAAEPGGGKVNRAGKSENKPVGVGSGGDVDGLASDAGEPRQRSRRSSRSSSAVGIFDDLAPTILGEALESPPQGQAVTQQHEDSTTRVEGGSSAPAAIAAIGEISFGGLVMQAQARWAIFTHLGARTVAAGSDGSTTAVAGIIDRAALYNVESETTMAAGRHLGTLDSIDGAAPTTSCTVWMEDGSNDGGTLGDGKSFRLPSPVFRSFFGAELSRRASTQSCVPCPTRPSSDPGAVKSTPKTASVALVGDRTGTVRWSPMPPCPGVPGSVLACLPGEKTAIVAILPQLQGESRAVGVLLVGANGVVLSLTATAESVEPSHSRVSRKRPRPDDAEANGRSEGGRSRAGGGERTTAVEIYSRASPAVRTRNPQPPPLSSVRRRHLGLPFPVDAACSVPGFLVHCHAGALFATAVPTAREGHEETGLPLVTHSNRSKRLGLSGVSAPVIPLRPVRLPLHCDTVGVAVAPVFTAEVEGARATSSGDTDAGVRQTLVLSLSARGRLVGFMAPQSAKELEGWALDTGKGGVRVGGSAGVERRVRCQLERLSSLGRQCAVLSAESAERDLEIRLLRGATVLMPPLAAAIASRRRRNDDGGLHGPWQSLGHSLSMAPDMQDAAAGFVDSYGGGSDTTQHDALRVRLCVRLWPRDGDRAREELQTVGEDHGTGRWFIVTRIVEAGSGSSSSSSLSEGISDDAEKLGEGWAWSTSAIVPMGFLSQGWPWSYSAALTLPSACPVTVNSWLQFRFGANADDNGIDGDHRLTAGIRQDPHEEAAGVCVELGSSRFDVFDWGTKLPSVPRSAAAIRMVSRGRGFSFCGPELAIADVFDRCSSGSGGVEGGGGHREDGGLGIDSTKVCPTVPAAWSSFRLRVASPDRDAGALLALLLPSLASSPPTSARNGVGGDGRSGVGDGPAEAAIRVAGQVAVIRMTGCALTAADEGGFGGRAVEVAVTCSHAAMAPLVREALLSRAGALMDAPPKNDRGRGSDVGKCSGGSGSEDSFVRQQGDAVAQLVRDVYPIGQAVVDVGDAARALGAARASDGPSAKSAEEALALMHRVGEVYHRLRLQQAAVGLLL